MADTKYLYGVEFNPTIPISLVLDALRFSFHLNISLRSIIRCLDVTMEFFEF